MARLLGDIGPAEEVVQDAAIFPEVAATGRTDRFTGLARAGGPPPEPASTFATRLSVQMPPVPGQLRSSVQPTPAPWRTRSWAC
jgi:hypothetical protein